jgi:hypothetical protein
LQVSDGRATASGITGLKDSLTDTMHLVGGATAVFLLGVAIWSGWTVLGLPKAFHQHVARKSGEWFPYWGVAWKARHSLFVIR